MFDRIGKLVKAWQGANPETMAPMAAAALNDAERLNAFIAQLRDNPHANSDLLIAIVSSPYAVENETLFNFLTEKGVVARLTTPTQGGLAHGWEVNRIAKALSDWLEHLPPAQQIEALSVNGVAGSLIWRGNVEKIKALFTGANLASRARILKTTRAATALSLICPQACANTLRDAKLQDKIEILSRPDVLPTFLSDALTFPHALDALENATPDQQIRMLRHHREPRLYTLEEMGEYNPSARIARQYDFYQRLQAIYVSAEFQDAKINAFPQTREAPVKEL